VWTWTLTYTLLRDKWDLRGATGPGAGFDELRTLAGFFLQQQGSFLPFLFDDPTDDSVTGQFLGTADGATAAFQLVRTMGGFAEPVTAPNTLGAVYLNGIRQSAGAYTVDTATGLVTFAAAPAAGQTVTADFTYWFRVRFAADNAEFENFLYQLWQLKQLKLQSALL
jgi:uncharacterized protein (TIGR02217 family)